MGREFSNSRMQSVRARFVHIEPNQLCLTTRTLGLLYRTLEIFGMSNVDIDDVGRGQVSRHVKPWTHIIIPYIAEEALRPTSKTGTDRSDRSHVAIHEYC